MFWKIVGGIVAFFVVVAMAVMLLATAGVAVLGVAVGSIVDNLDISTIQVTDTSGKTETYDVDTLVSESGRVEITSENGERVTIDLNVPQIAVQESGDDAARVVIGGGPRLEINPDASQIRIDGRRFDNFDGSFIVRPVVGFFRGLFNLIALTLVAVGIWLVLRNRRPAAAAPKEKTPNATA